MPLQIFRAYERLENISKDFYDNNSIICSNSPSDLGGYIQGGINPETAVLMILNEEERQRAIIKKLERRKDLFESEFTVEERRTMKRNVKNKKITYLEKRAFEFIGNARPDEELQDESEYIESKNRLLVLEEVFSDLGSEYLEENVVQSRYQLKNSEYAFDDLSKSLEEKYGG